MILAGNFVYSDMRNSGCYSGYLQWSAWGTRHWNSVALINNRTIGAYVVVVFLNVTSWLSDVLCSHGYKPSDCNPSVLEALFSPCLISSRVHWEGVNHSQAEHRSVSSCQLIGQLSYLANWAISNFKSSPLKSDFQLKQSDMPNNPRRRLCASTAVKAVEYVFY